MPLKQEIEKHEIEFLLPVLCRFVTNCNHE